eukprot:TRINITY_DN3550_c0_g5_i1.p1 TRINITY_DN3550_c0_g5~~TRINITY_DN3550_c0_g5_i1.p1  ORF type:complete len:1503 (+),score=529.45 TRINITY_DN3550_c0_g5_i1:55-4563(+)
MGSVLVDIAVGVFNIIRFFFAVLSFALGLASMAVPWRIAPGVATLGGTKNINDWIVRNWGMLLLSILDVITIVPFCVTLCTWRNWQMVRGMWKKWDDRCLAKGFLHYNFDIRGKIWKYFLRFLSDIPFIIMTIISTVMVWRAPIFYAHLAKGVREKASASERRTQIMLDTIIGIADIILVPVGLLILLTCYRVKETYNKVKGVDCDTTDLEDTLAMVCKQRTEVLKQGAFIFVDAFHLLLLLVTCVLLIRIPAVYRDIRTESSINSKVFGKISRRNFLLSFRELLALVLYIIMFPFIYRFYLALSSALEKCADQADPRPHCQITKVVPEFLQKGFKLHIEGHKTPDLPAFTKTRLFVRDDALWKNVSNTMGSTVATIAKGFLPYKVTINNEDFVENKVDFKTTIHFDIKASKKGIVKGIRKIGESTVGRFDIEWGKCAGTLMSLKFRLGSLCDCANDDTPEADRELELHEQYEPSLDVRDTTSAAIFLVSKPIPGALFCDTMAAPAFIQFLNFLTDIIALVLFILIHLVPWRAYTMYRSMSLSTEQQDRFVVAKTIKKLNKALRETEAELETSYTMVDDKVKNRRLAPYSQYGYYWYHSYMNDDGNCRSHADFCRFMRYLIKGHDKLVKLGCSEAAKEMRMYILSLLRSHCSHILQAWEKARYVGTLLSDKEETKSSIWARFGFGTGETANLDSLCSWLTNLRDAMGVKKEEDPEVFLVDPSGECTQLSVQMAYKEAMRIKEREKTTRDNIRSALSSIVTDIEASYPSISCKGIKPSKKAIYIAVKDFATDLAALICILLVVCTLYRIPVLVRSLRDSYSFHHTAFTNAMEIPMDLLYLLKALFVFAGIRNIISFPVAVFEYTLQCRTYEAARKVVDYYFELVVYDWLQLLGRIFSCESLKWIFGGVGVGFLTPGVLVEALILRGDSVACCSGVIIVLTSGWLYGWAGASVAKLLPDGQRELSFGLYYGVLAALMLAYFLSTALSSSELKSSVRVTHSRFVRPNWFNSLQFIYAFMEGLWAVALVGRLYPESDLHAFFRAVLLDFDASDGYPLGTYIAIVAIGAYYVLVALPIIVMALNMSTKICEYNSWVFFMGLLSQGLQLLIVFNATNVLFCDETEGYEGGTFAPFGDVIHCYYDTKHITLAALSMLGFAFYSLTTIMKIPEYTTSYSTMLDIVFVELYESLVRFGIMCIGVMAVVLRHYNDATVAAVLAGLVWCTMWTLFYPSLFSATSHVCSVQLFTVWRIACYAMAAASVVAIRVNQSSGSAVTFSVFAVLLAGVAAGFAWKMMQMYKEDIVGLEVTPEQVQQDLRALHKAMREKGALASGLSDAAWEGMVQGNTRASPLALCLMQLEHHARLSHLHAVFLSTRAEWYTGLWKLVDDDDMRRDFMYKLRYKDFDDEFFWACNCCCDDDHDYRETNKRLVDSVEDISTLNTYLQRFKNSIISDSEVAADDDDDDDESKAEHDDQAYEIQDEGGAGMVRGHSEEMAPAAAADDGDAAV